MSSDDWPRVRLADLCESIDYGYTQSASDEPIGPKFLRITDIVSGPIDWSSVPYCAADSVVAAKYRLRDGDIVIARTGATTGTSAFIQSPHEAVFASYLVRLSINRSKAAPRFVAFYLKSPAFWSFIRGVLGDKSAQPNASAKTMTQDTLRLPPMPEQISIAETLGALDDKIELHGRMNRALEAITRAVFKSWFVDFDPVHGTTEHNNAELWPKVPFSETVQVLSGGTPRTSEPDFWGGGLPWYSVADAPSDGDIFVTDTEKTISSAGVESSAAQLVPDLTTIVSARGTVGKCALTGRKMAFNQSCYGLRPKDSVGYYFTYFSTRNLVEELRRSAHGSVFSTITRDTLRDVCVRRPPSDLVAAFERTVGPLMQHILLGVEQSKSLTSTRDALLPRLLSGDLAAAGETGASTMGRQ